MGLFNVLDISAAGLNVERSRLEVAVTNLANAETTTPANGVPYQPLEAVVRSGAPARPIDGRLSEGGTFESSLPLPFVEQLAPMHTTPRRVHDPGHPDADAQGFVTYPGVDPVTTMLDLLSISRSYEANVKAFDITRTLLERTIDLGGTQR
jgi:flagellar basal-body rod protein FlgC